jgi:nucleotide-binding universal stress UspA family protein
MSYKSILLHLEPSSHLPQRIAFAAALARRMDAHLIGVATSGVSRFVETGVAMGGDPPLLAEHLQYLRKRAKQLVGDFAQLAQNDGPLSFETRQLEDDDSGALCLQARYCDLLVLGQQDPHEAPASWPDDLVPYVVLNGARPVLIVPYQGQAGTLDGQILVAWDGRPEATRALTAALPLLRAARGVTVALFNPKRGPADHGDEPGADIALFLARHGVQVEVRCLSAADVGKALLALAGEIHAGLLVMGCYGRSRLHEILVGGTTRTVLAEMTLPVLMAH